MSRIVVIVMLYMSCASCATTNHPRASDLRPVEKPSYFKIDETTYEIVKRGLIGIETLEGLKKGVYVAIGKSDTGTYYFGRNCYLFLQEKRIREIYHGGVFIPDNNLSQARLFMQVPDHSDKVYGLIPQERAKKVAGQLALQPSILNASSISKINIKAGTPAEDSGCIVVPKVKGWTM